MVAATASSYGQGVLFTSYSANGNVGVNWFLGVQGSSTTIPSSFHADLYYFVGTTTDPVNTTLASSITALPLGTFTDLGVTGVTFNQPYQGANFFNGPQVMIPGNPATVTFEVVAYNGSSYATSLIRGRSGAFTDVISTSAGTGAKALGAPDQNGTGEAFPVSYVTSVPEPTTLALAGLGGLASLVAFRRKQA